MSRNSLCACGSGKRHKHCCGSLEHKPGRSTGSDPAPHIDTAAPASNQAPDELGKLITRKRLPKSWGWQGLLRQIQEGASKPLGVVSAAGEIVHDRQRVTDVVDTRAIQAGIRKLISRFLIEVVEPVYACEVEWYEEPQVLRYRKGGYYRPHSDRDYWNHATGRWQQCLDRDISVLIYLNDGFEGGQLCFPTLGESIDPKPGLAVAFPSDFRFQHAAEPVTGGVRHAIVSWAACTGGARVNRRGSQFTYQICRTKGQQRIPG